MRFATKNPSRIRFFHWEHCVEIAQEKGNMKKRKTFSEIVKL
jgi:hypothetical protein